MGEVVHIQIGQSGNRVGTLFYEHLCEEHGLDYTGAVISTEHSQSWGRNRYFSEEKSGHYSARSIQVDMDRDSLDEVSVSPCRALFPSYSYICDSRGSGNVFARGWCGEGTESVLRVEEAVRKITEECETIQGIQLCYSTGGGSAGLAMNALGRLREEYGDAIITAFSLLPSLSLPHSVLSAYNSLFCFLPLSENCDMNILIHNGAILRLCSQQTHITSPTIHDMNGVIAQALVGVSSTWRFPGTLTSSMRKLAVNLVPERSYQYLSVSEFPLLSGHFSTEAVATGLINPAFSMSSVNSRIFGCLTAAATFRGAASSYEAEAFLTNPERYSSGFYCMLLPSPSSVAYISPPKTGCPVSGTLLANSAGISDSLEEITTAVTKLYRRKAFMHWFEGMDEMMIQEAESNLSLMATVYKNLTETHEATDFD